MKKEFTYTKSQELAHFKAKAKEHGYKMTSDAYWCQIFENESGDMIITSFEEDKPSTIEQAFKSTITTTDTFGNVKSYQVVEKIPHGFHVWNIGDNMGHDEYIPLCEKLNPGASKDSVEYYSINPNTVKAIKLNIEEVKLLRRA